MSINPDPSMEQLILETAESMFLEKGFTATSTTQIAKAVGCNQALVHYYFRTKENLFNQIFEQKFKNFFEGVFNMQKINALSFMEKIKYIIETHFEILLANPKMPYLILNELTRNQTLITMLKEKIGVIPKQIIDKLEIDLQVEIEKGKVCQTSIIDLVISIISLNLTLFLLMPIAENILQLNENMKSEILTHRKQENISLILNSLRP